MADISAAALKAAIDQWSTKTHPSLGLAEYRDTAIERVFGSNPLLFTRGQEVVNQMLDYNRQLGSPLTEAELVAGINKFSKSQYDQYGRNYQVDSDPFNIGRWSVALALIDKGMSDAGSALIKATDARQAITSQQAIELGKLADDQYTKMSAKYDELSQPHSASFGDILGAVATGLGVMFAPVGIAGALGGLAGGAVGSIGSLVGFGGSEAALGSGISSGAGGVTGISAGAGGATGVTGSVAGLSGGMLAPATTGGLLVGSEGFLGSTGNAIGDQVLNSAGQNAIKSAVTGGDPVQGALQGAAGGLIGASGIGSGAADMVGATGDAATAITTGVNAAAGSGAMTAINGGSFSDILENSAISGVSQGAGSYVSNALDSGSNAIDRGVGGAVAGGTNAALTGGDVGTGLLTSGLAGAAGGLATDLGASPAVSGVVQGVTGGLVNSALQPDDVVNPPPATAPTATTTRPDVSSVSFSDVIPQFVDKSVEWGTRLQQSGGI